MTGRRWFRWALLLGLLGLLGLAALSCGDAERAREPAAHAAPERPAQLRATLAIKRYVDARVAELVDAAEAMCAAAPEPDAGGWSPRQDARAVERMRRRWRDARRAYERVEGAIAILFPELDVQVDARYEHHAELHTDEAPFDGRGFVGMHAVERILWADSIAPPVLDFERSLPGYVPAATPASRAEARAFRDGLCARLVRDVRRMQQQLEPLALDPQTAWRGIQGSIEEQAEKVLLGATGQDESRYARTTLADLRANLEGGRAVLEAYRPRIAQRPEAAALRPEIEARMAALERAYGSIEGDALPPVPDGFDPDEPSAADLRTPYGRLFSLLATASDPRAEGSLAATLRRAGEAMDIPPLSR